MRIRTAILVSLLGVAVLIPAGAVAQSDNDCSFPIERTDATGAIVNVSQEPQRIVTLNPSAAQTMWEIGAWDKVVGATKHASNLEGFENLKNISGAGETISNEKVVDLNPDLVLAPHTIQNDTVRTLRDANRTIYRFHEAESIADIANKTHLVGRFTGECSGAEDTVDWMESRLAIVDQTTEGQDRPTALYVFYGYTAGSDTFLHKLIERAGAKNAAAAYGISNYEIFNEEILVSMELDWLILNSDWTTVPKNAAYNETRAVEEDQIVIVNTNHLNRPGPRVVYAVEDMARAFHPESFDAADTTETTTDATGNEIAPESTDTNAPPTTDGTNGPGFGIVMAVLAIIAVGLFQRL